MSKFFNFLILYFSLILLTSNTFAFVGNSSNFYIEGNFGNIQTSGNSTNYSIKVSSKNIGSGFYSETIPATTTVSSSSSSGGGCGGSGAYSNNFVGTVNSQIINTSNSGNSLKSSLNSIQLKKIVGPKAVTEKKFEILVENNSIDITSSNFTGLKKVQLKSKKTNKNVVEFSFEFRENLDLSKLEIKSENQSKNNYVIVKGLDLKGKTKTITLGIVDSTKTLCIKDAEISSISELSKTCTSNNEYLLTCDNKLGVNGYTCKIKNNEYIISGLKHSGVLEVNSNLITTKAISNSSINDTNSTINNSEALNKNNSANFPKLYIYLGIGILLIIILGMTLILNKNPKTANQPIDLSLNKSNYELAKGYVKKYKNQFSKEELYQKLKKNGYDEEILQKVLSEEFN